MNTHPRSLSRQNRGGILVRIVVILALAVALSAVAWVLFLPAIVSKVVASRTGFAFKSATLSANPFAGSVHLAGVTIENPATYPKPDFVDLREMSADVDVGSLFSEKLIIESAKLDLEALTLIRAIDGTLNAELFADRLRGEGAPASSEQPKAETPRKGGPKPYVIRHLEVRVGKLRTENYAGLKPSAREFTIGFAQSYENVTDLKQLATGPVMKGFNAAGAALTNILPSEWGKLLEDSGKGGKNLLRELGRKATDAARGTSEALEESRKP